MVPTRHGDLRAAGFRCRLTAVEAGGTLLVEAGFTPLQTLSMATLTGAKFLGVDDEVGSIEIGKRADLILVQGEPDKDIASVQNVALVFKDGITYDPAALIDSVPDTVGP